MDTEDSEEILNYKGLLQTWCSQNRRRNPRYAQVSCVGTPPLYTFVVYSGTHRLGIGTGGTKKDAQKEAARVAYEDLHEASTKKTEAPHAQQTRSQTHRKELRAESLHRKSARGSKQGRDFEQMVIGYLEELKQQGSIDSFVYHQPRSEEDHDGKDFTIEKSGTSVSFGVTISRRSAVRSRGLHPHVTIFHFPHNTKPETVQKRVLVLLEGPT